MVNPFNLERPGRIAIAISGYDPRRQVEILKNKQKQMRKKKVTLAPVACASEQFAVVPDADIDSLNAALHRSADDSLFSHELLKMFVEGKSNAAHI